MSRESYEKWKSALPLLYDWFAHHHVTAPSLTCRWGPILDETKFRSRQRIYFAEQSDGSGLHVLSIASIDVCKARVATEESMRSWKIEERCPMLTIDRQIVHSGDVNRVRECPLYPDVIVTHTDSAQLYVWNAAQGVLGDDSLETTNVTHLADLVLVGHQDLAPYAISMSTRSAKIASGGHDHKAALLNLPRCALMVLIWDLHDHVTSLINSTPSPATQRELQAQICLEGHDGDVEGVVFRPDSAEELASVGKDYKLLFWDTRTHTLPIATLLQAHGRSVVHCVDWNPNGSLIATGDADGVIHIWDRRKLTADDACVLSFNLHKKAVTHLEWDPSQERLLASGGEDGMLCIWDVMQSRTLSPDVQENKRARRSVPHELIFQHAGHNGPIMDFQWNALDPWTVMSVSDDVTLGNGGGSLQMWRVSDLIYRPEDEVLDELKNHARWIVSGKRENGDTVGLPRNGHSTTVSDSTPS